MKTEQHDDNGMLLPEVMTAERYLGLLKAAKLTRKQVLDQDHAERLVVAISHGPTVLSGAGDPPHPALILPCHFLDGWNQVWPEIDQALRDPCPKDTDGDGNCGQRMCPYCGWEGDED